MSMQLSQSMGQRMDQRQLLTPRMIQSMEILQMPLDQLEERIEMELQSNPTLEQSEDRGERDADGDTYDLGDDGRERLDDNRPLEVGDEKAGLADDFERLAKMADYLGDDEYGDNLGGGRLSDHGPATGSYAGERDAKLDAMANTASRAGTIGDHLLEQWRFIDAPADVCRAGEILIGSVDADGYLRQSIDEVRAFAEKRNRNGHAIPPADAFERALHVIQTQLEPAGVGARDLKECLLLQLHHLRRDPERAVGHDFDLETKLIRDHLKDLEMNRYPQISKKLGRDIPDLQAAVQRIGRLSPHPGNAVGRVDDAPITPDAIITYNEETREYEVDMTYDPAPNLYIRAAYRKMLKDRSVAKDTREFLSGNVRNARWLIESIKQRRGTIERVIHKVVEHQRDFFDRGPEHLRPLPMIQVADELGIHVATVSRAVADKHIQAPRGIFPVRRFFSGGTTSDDGEEMSWDAVKEKLKSIVADEDKQQPLNDDQIVDALKEQGIDLARRTVAKYRKLLNIPTARQRKAY